MTHRTLLLCVLCTLLAVSVFAQNKAERKTDLPGVADVHFAENNDIPKFIRFNPSVVMNTAEAQVYLQKQFGLSDRTSFTVLSAETDKLGIKHTRIQQQHDGKNVMGGVYLIHERDGRVESMSGKLFDFSEVADVPATVTKDAAVATALQHVPAETYGWEVPAIHHDGHTHTRSEYPNPELV